MMRTLIALAVAALLAIALASRAPATLVDGRVSNLTAGRVRVANAAGTLWNGSGDIVVVPTGAAIHIVWHIDALPLLRGELRGTLGQLGASAAAFSLQRDRDEVTNLALALPAGVLLRAIEAPAIAADARGTVDVRVEHLVRQRDTIDGRIELRWLDASMPGPRPDIRIALGDIRIACAGSGAELPGTVTNTGGDVDIAGGVVLAANGAVRIDTRIRPRDTLDAERAGAIASGLSLLGTRDGSGGFRVTGAYSR